MPLLAAARASPSEECRLGQPSPAEVSEVPSLISIKTKTKKQKNPPNTSSLMIHFKSGKELSKWT